MALSSLNSILEAAARRFVVRFLSSYISSGCLILHEEASNGSDDLKFCGSDSDHQCSLKVDLNIHNPQFYWKIMTRGDVGLADAYIDGDFSLPDGDEGLFNLFMLMLVNKDAKKSSTKLKTKRGWWTPLMFTAVLGSGKLFYQHVLRQNSLTQARRNISRHYDVSNDVFSLFLGETMIYSTGIFKAQDEDLKTAQLRKISVLVEKARIEKMHHVLDIGCGWGTFGIEVVKRTGCKYTGITLSQQQLNFAELKVKQAGLQDNITLELCDYRQLPKTHKYDRIISCEMIEHVGDEYMDEFFGCCESLLADNGLFVLQFISMADEEYDEYKRSAGFIKEYIFPGGLLPSFSRVISAMKSSSRLSVEHVENIGSHYCRTLRLWRKNLLNNKSKILELEFDEKFIRTWEYYFDYCASGFKTYMLGDYQVVFSRPGNFEALGNPYKGFPSAYCTRD
ncbi:Cyclopropane-fatty-acyl-phospholipid synthase [Euphorbia peplus]|nr:Cyclopropane-fatty-acyl-phospholipid synthase [Euphorbia peplus]